MRQCRACRETKPLVDFYHNTNGNRAEYLDCKRCHSARTATWHQNNPNVRRENNWLQRGIKLTVDEYETLYRSQEGRCKICGRAEPVSGRRLAVDHDHSTGEIRGLLCTKCNTTVGWVEQYPTLLDYLKGSELNGSNA